MVTMLNRLIRIIAISSLMLLPVLAQAEVSAKVDRYALSIGETFTLILTVDSTSIWSKPNIDALRDDFQILSNNRSTRHSIINGKSESLTEWRLILSPKNAGQLTIPALEIQGEKTQPITLTVSKQSTDKLDNNRDVFLDVSVNPGQGMVQSELLVSIKLYYSVSLQDYGVADLSLTDAFVERLDDKNYQTSINGRTYGVYEERYALFPTKSGELVIPPLVAEVIIQQRRRTFADPFGSAQRRMLRSLPVTVPIEDIPSGFTGQLWLPAKQLSLQQQWSHQDASITVGDSLSRTIQIQAEGLTAEQLPPMPIPEIDGVKVYPDQSKTENKKHDQGVVGLRQDSYALIATRPGQFTLPAITLEWWNTETKQLERAELPARTITVVAASNTGNAVNTPAAVDFSNNQATAVRETEPKVITRNNPFWMWLSAGLFVAWMLTLALLLWQQRKRSTAAIHPAKDAHQQDSLDQAYQKLTQALQANNSAQVRASLLHWAQLLWPGRIHALADIGNQAGDRQLQNALMALDTALYQQADAAWPANEIAEKVTRLQQQHRPISSSLPTLYAQ